MITYDYSPYTDIAVFMIAVAMIIILAFTYTKKSFYFMLLFIGIINISLAALSSIAYNMLLQNIEFVNKYLIYAVHDAFYTFLTSIWVLFIIYVYALSVGIKNRKKIRNFVIFLFCVLVSYVVVEALSDVTKFGFYIEDNIAYEHFLMNPFMLYYVTLGSSCLIYFLRNKKLFPRKVYINILFLFIYCLSIMISQGFINTTSFNTITFFIPVITIFYLLHSNGYDIDTGALGPEVFYDYLSERIKKREEFTIVTLKFAESNIELSEGLDISYVLSRICRFCDFQYKNAALFQKNKNIINIVTKNTNQEENIKATRDLQEYIETNFKNCVLGLKYAIVKYDSSLEINDAKILIDFNKYVINKYSDEDINICTEDDVRNFKKQYYIKEQLTEIALKKDLDDPRIVVYCQPIVNTSSLCKNAEILMRLELPETGMVYPNDFIPIAEENKLIHQMTLIILHKTSREIKRLMDEGYEIDRFSVNFSANEFNIPMFYEEVISIIDDVGIPYNKLAFEVTETTFNKIDNLSVIMERLKKLGIVFYLDDFGTGYSNMDRIIELPFSTIKFDRSLVISSLQKDNSKFIVNSLCDIFSKLNFNVLFEGIETGQDEEMCLGMGANYLQGYRYSKPIPVENIRDFLSKK